MASAGMSNLGTAAGASYVAEMCRVGNAPMGTAVGRLGGSVGGGGVDVAVAVDDGSGVSVGVHVGGGVKVAVDVAVAVAVFVGMVVNVAMVVDVALDDGSVGGNGVAEGKSVGVTAMTASARPADSISASSAILMTRTMTSDVTMTRAANRAARLCCSLIGAIEDPIHYYVS